MNMFKSLSIAVAQITILLLFSAVTCFSQEERIPQIVINPKGHSARINNIVYTPDGSKIISVSDDKSIRIWDANTGEAIKKFETEINGGAEGALYASAISPQGNLLAVAGYPVGTEQNYIVVIDINKETQIAIAKGHSDVILALEFSGDGKYLISGSADGTLKFFNVDKSVEYKEVATINVEYPVNSLSVNTKTNEVAIATRMKDIRVYDFSTIASNNADLPFKTFKKHKGEINKVAYSPDGKFLASSSLNSELVVWKANGSFLFLNEEYLKPLNALAFSYDSRVLVGLDIEGRGFSYAIPSGSLYTSDFKGHDNVVFSAAFSPNSTDGNYVIASAGGIQNEIIQWNAISAKTVRIIRGKGSFIGNLAFGEGLKLFISTSFSSLKPKYEYSFDFNEFTLTPDPVQTDLIVGTEQNKDLKLNKDLISIELPRGKKITNNPSIDGYIHSFISTPDGRIIVGSDFSLKMYNSNGLFLKEFSGHTGGVWTLACSADGKYVASGGEDQTVKLWKIDETGYAPGMAGYFKGEDDIMSLFSDLKLDSLSLIETRKAWEAAIKIIKENTNTKTTRFFQEQYDNLGETIVPFSNFFVSNEGEWVCWAPSGYFSCSSSGADSFGWHLNNGVGKLADYYSADQYFEILYRPQLLVKSFQQVKRVENILRDEGEIIFDLSKLSRPSAGLFDINDISIGDQKILDYEQGKFFTTTHTIPLNVDIFDGGGGIREVNIYQNGKLIVNDLDVKSLQEVKQIERTYNVELVNGTNNFKLVVVNFQGIESRADLLKIEYIGKEIITSSLHILSVGINKYQKEQYNLNYAQPDASSFAKKFVENGTGLFKNVKNKIELYDEQATKENILKAFELIISQSNPEDMFVFYYAGHGTIDEKDNNEYYLVPPDITELYGDSKQLKDKGISASELKQLLYRIKSTKQLILMDACHSGAAVEAFQDKSKESERERAITQLARSSGVAMLTSSNSQQFASEFEVLQHGVFTYTLLEALSGAADTGDEKISVYELKLYMERMVPILSKKYGGESQKPIAHVFGNDFSISLVGSKTENGNKN